MLVVGCTVLVHKGQSGTIIKTFFFKFNISRKTVESD